MPKLLFALSFILLLSCSKKEENTPIINIASLTLSTDSPDDILVIGEAINFTVTGDDGVEYNDVATFYVDLAPISGTSHAFTTEGSHDVYASYGGVNSNTVTFNVVNGTESTFIVEEEKVLREQENSFTLIDVEGNDVSTTASFFVNGTAISNNVFSSSTTGIFEVYATYDLAGTTVTTETKSFEVYIPKRKVVLEDYTGTWCGYCPAVAAAIEDVHEVTNDIAIVAIHETSFSYPDPMHFDQVQDLKDAFGVDGLPAARINRTATWLEPYATGEVTSMAGQDTDTAIAISSQVEGQNLSVEVKIISEQGIPSGKKLVVYLLESGIIHDQVNYYNTVPGSPFYGLGNPIPDFVHNETLRLSLSSSIFGDSVSETAALTEYSKSLSVAIPSDYVVANLSLVAMLVNDDNSAINAQFAHVNEAKNYE
ncbi:Thioredoxin [Ulvibacter litoralis]|uniref:Thioredoxin n=2 Tax=Ulvibacter litoralis TaxID=227084 RepID=A0A1G7GGY2_9FLAO|nr:Thioredoxin [Ulvibacter litoralis]